MLELQSSCPQPAASSVRKDTTIWQFHFHFLLKMAAWRLERSIRVPLRLSNVSQSLPPKQRQCLSGRNRSLCSRRLCMGVCKSGQPIPYFTFSSRFNEFVRMMACVVCASHWEAGHFIVRVTASASMIRL